MSKIQIMDTQLANMIAAGEVVERPSGIVKELIENALDAKADDIQIIIEEGGMTAISVIDNGEGMSKEDLQNAFKRHSTSKIHKVKDLNHIHTFGFRGEALPSIASVSEVKMNSNNGNESYEIVIDNGETTSLEVFARNKGTSIKVSHLFSKVPARLKYIKNPRYEASIVLDIVQKFAMGHPHIRFSLEDDGKVVFKSFGSNLLDVFYRVFGKSASENMIELKVENYDFKVQSYLAQPAHTRSNRNHLWVYINDRMIRHFKIQNAVVEGYRRHIPKDRFPMGVIKIYVDPQLVDVNVHPSKWEIRLSKEPELIALITSEIEKALTKDTQAPKIRIEQPVFEQTTLLEALLESEPFEKPIQFEKTISKEVEPVFAEETSIHPEPVFVEETIIHPEPTPSSSIEPLKVLSQMSGKYILAQGDAGLYIIDQHAAMERVRYEYFQEKLLNKQSPQQPLLFPLVLEGRRALIYREAEVKEAFETLQVKIEVLDGDSFVVRERPQWMKENELDEFSNKVLDFLEDHKTVREADFRSNAIATLACHSSVRFNEYMSLEAMETLVQQLRNANQPYHCPHGRPTFMLIDHDQLWKGFLR